MVSRTGDQEAEMLRGDFWKRTGTFITAVHDTIITVVLA